MFKIIKDGETIAITEKLHFIKQDGNGIYKSCSEKEAQGVAVKNTPYNLVGREAMNGCATVSVMEIDAGAHIQAGDVMQTETDALVVDHEYRIALIELGV